MLTILPAPSGPLPKSPRFTPVIQFLLLEAASSSAFFTTLLIISLGFYPRPSDGTERAVIITSILYFQKCSCAVIHRPGGVEAGHFIHIATTDLCRIAFGQFTDMCCDIKFSAAPKTRSTPGIEAISLVSAGHSSRLSPPGFPVLTLNAAHQLPAFFICIVSNRTGIDHIYISQVIKLLFSKPSVSSMRKGRCLWKLSFCSQGVKCHCSCFGHSRQRYVGKLTGW